MRASESEIRRMPIGVLGYPFGDKANFFGGLVWNDLGLNGCGWIFPIMSGPKPDLHEITTIQSWLNGRDEWLFGNGFIYAEHSAE
jgi:hypothetical protein